MWVIDILSAGDNWKITHMWVIDILSAGGNWKITHMWVIGRRICFTISISYLCFNFTVEAVNITKRVDLAEKCKYKVKLSALKFCMLYVNANPLLRRKRDWIKFSIRHSSHILITHSWFSSCGEEKYPPLLASPVVEDIFFTTPAEPFMGNENVPFVTHGEFIFPHSWLTPLMGKNPIPFSPQYRIGSFPTGVLFDTYLELYHGLFFN